MSKKPEVKAVEMTRRIRGVHHEQLKDATREERMAFFNRAARRTPSQVEEGVSSGATHRERS